MLNTKSGDEKRCYIFSYKVRLCVLAETSHFQLHKCVAKEVLEYIE